MITLPFIVSVPHSGRLVAPEVRDLCILKTEDLLADGDVGAREIYEHLRDRVASFVTTDVARAIVDLNRSEVDRGPDGVVKTHTCWEVPVYGSPLPEAVVVALLERYHRPYHERLGNPPPGTVLGIDCHTMAEFGPPVGPDPGRERPRACVGDGHGSCPPEWAEAMARCLNDVLGDPVTVNRPFVGGFITRSRPGGIPWMQVELSRASWMSDADKGRAVRSALVSFAGQLASRRSDVDS